jgi:hypothetical protein
MPQPCSVQGEKRKVPQTPVRVIGALLLRTFRTNVGVSAEGMAPACLVAALLGQRGGRAVFIGCPPDVSFHSCPPRRRFMSPDEVIVSL